MNDSESKIVRITAKDGLHLIYEVRGEGDPTLVFIHGGFCHRRYWASQLELFSKTYRVAAVDLAGHGDSGKDRREWTMESFGRDMASVVAHLKNPKVILIGHSFGGSVMLEAARHLTDSVIGLVSIDSLADPERRYPMDQIMELLRNNFKNHIRNNVRTTFGTGMDPLLVKNLIDEMTEFPEDIGLQVMELGLRYYNDGICRQTLREIEIPVRYIHTMAPVNEETFKTYGIDIKGTNMKRTGHFPMLSAASKFNRLLMTYVEELSQKNLQRQDNL